MRVRASMMPHDGHEKIELGGEIFRLPVAIVARQPSEMHMDAHTKPFTPVIQMKRGIEEGQMLQGPLMSRWIELLSMFHFQMTAPDHLLSITGNDRQRVKIEPT